MYPIQIPPLERGIVCIVNIYLIYGVITYRISSLLIRYIITKYSISYYICYVVKVPNVTIN